MSETVASIVAAHRTGTVTPEQTVARSYARIRAYGDEAVFITLRPEADVLAEARALAVGRPRRAPALRRSGRGEGQYRRRRSADDRGLSGLQLSRRRTMRPRWRGCAPPARIVIGKTNLDQFATGLVGVRSPYGVPRNTFNADLIPGGSSSGSAVAVAAGLVPLALGTDTAGSGRVPAGFNNIVGLKPSLGLVSTYGVVPACRTLDCVSVFALTVDDAWTALAAMAGPDAKDPYSRQRPLGGPAPCRRTSNSACRGPASGCSSATGNTPPAYDAALERLARLGCEIVEIDIEPFYETARLLYEGPWVAERTLTARSLLASDPDAIHPVTREIILSGLRPTAIDAFAAFYKLEELRRVADHTFRSIDALALPTAPTVYTVKQVLADPIQLNSRLGTYTNFVNLLDLCGLALPAAMTDSGVPFGITLLAPGGADARLAEIGRVFHADTALPLGALKVAAAGAVVSCRNRRAAGEVAVGRRRRASVGPAAQRRIARARRTPARGDEDRARLPTLCAVRHDAAETGPVARRKRRRRRDRGRDLGACRWKLSAASPTRCRRRFRSARSGCRTAAPSKVFWSRPRPRPARATFQASADGGPIWRVKKSRLKSSVRPRASGDPGLQFLKLMAGFPRTRE